MLQHTHLRLGVQLEPLGEAVAAVQVGDRYRLVSAGLLGGGAVDDLPGLQVERPAEVLLRQDEVEGGQAVVGPGARWVHMCHSLQYAVF